MKHVQPVQNWTVSSGHAHSFSLYHQCNSVTTLTCDASLDSDKIVSRAYISF